MNCKKCNTPLETNARFCPKCGEPTAGAARNATFNPSPHYQTIPMNEPSNLPRNIDEEAPTIPPSHLQMPPAGQMAQQYQQLQPTQQVGPQGQPPMVLPSQQGQQGWGQQGQGIPQPQQEWRQPQGTAQPQVSYSQQRVPDERGNALAASAPAKRKRRSLGGCLLRMLLVLVVLVVVVVGGWFVVGRTLVHNMAVTQINKALSGVVDQMPPAVSQAPSPLNVSENTINNLITLNTSPNDLVQHMQIHITPTEVRVDFQIGPFSCAVTGVPEIQNGKLVAVVNSVEGVISLIMTPDELTPILNQHLSDAQVKLNRTVQSIQLEDQQVKLVLGPAGGGTLPTLP